MSLSSTSLPKPKNWQDFEHIIRELFACVLNDPNTQKNGRSGQSQNGVDVYGYRNGNFECIVGVQCKQKFENRVTDKELRIEVEKAKNFKPKLNEFILTTTAPRDQKIQETARIITKELAPTDHPIRVYVWGWDDIEEHASKYPEALKAIDPTWNPFAEKGFAKVDMGIQKFTQKLETFMQGITQSPYSVEGAILSGNDENTPLHGEITAFQHLINEGHAKLALKQFQKIKRDKWANANRSERYRILIGIASAKLKLGKQPEAANLLIDAYSECPEYKNAKKNLATGHLINNSFAEAAKLAREMLDEDNNNDKAAGVLIQALINDTTCEDPLIYVPETIYDTEEVLISYVHFLRCRGNTLWNKIARSSAQKHPDSRILKIFSAEALLDELLRTDRDVIIGGIPRNIDFEEFKNAVEILYLEARDAIEKEYALLPSVGHNAVLGLRTFDDNLRAKEILAGILKQYPNDENLRLQQALILLSEKNEPARVLETLPDNSSNPEVIGLKASALVSIGEADDAISLIESIDETKLPENMKIAYFATRINAYMIPLQKAVKRSF